jgi:hypothetical protein
MIKILSTIVMLVVATTLGGCFSKEEIAAAKDKVASVVIAVKNGARVTTDTLLDSINTTCSMLGDINTDKAAVQAVILNSARTPGPKTVANLERVDQAVSAAQGICSRSVAGTGNTMANLLQLWSYYTSASNAVALAKQSSGST